MFLVLALLACDGGPVVTTTVGDSDVVSAPTYEGRAALAWKEVGSVSLTEGAIGVIQKVGTAVAVDVPEKLSGIPAGTKVLDIRSDPAVAGALWGTSEAALADALRGAGAKIIVVHNDVKMSFDRDSHVLSRLVRHDQLERFQLIRVENGGFVYLVVDQPLQFTPELAAQAVVWLRATMSGQHPAPFPAIPAERSNWMMVTSIRGQGQELAFSLAEAATLDKALAEAAVDLETMYRRQREIMGFPRLSVGMTNYLIDIHRIRERADVAPRDEESLQSLWEMGIDGAILVHRASDEEKAAGGKSQSGVWPGSVAATRGITKADPFLRGMARDFKWDSLRPWRDDEVSLEVIRDIHYAEVAGGGVAPMLRGTYDIPLSFVNLDTVKASILDAGEWWLANLQPDGSVTYKFWPEDDRYSDEYNHVRHELATWNLWQAYTLDPRPDFLEGAIRAENWTLQSTQIRNRKNMVDWERAIVNNSKYKDEINEKGMAYFTYANNTKLGSAVVGLFGMIEVAKTTGDHSKDELLRQIGRYVMVSQLENGSFRPYWVPPGHPYEHSVNDIVPGEAALSLVYLSEYFNDPQYLDVLPKFFEYYKPWFEERAVKRSEGGPWPAYIYDNATRLELVQFGPWTVMAADAYVHARPQAKDVAEFGLKVGKWMVESYEYRSDRTPWSDYVGGYYKFEGELPAMQAFCYSEGTAAAYHLALLADPAQAAYFETATRESVRFGFAMQHDGIDSVAFSRPNEIKGGVKYAMNEPKVRVDYTYHMQSSLYQWLRAAKLDPNLPEIARATPDEKMRTLLRWMDMPGYRPEGAFVRTSVPGLPNVAGNIPITPMRDDSDGGD